MTPQKTILTALNEDSYIQGFNARPAFVMPSAWSGLVMHHQVGFGYRQFLFHFHSDFGAMHYLRSDLDSIWRAVQKRLRQDPRFLIRSKTSHARLFAQHQAMFRVLDRTDLKNISDPDLVSLIRRCAIAQIQSVGIAHMIEPIGIELEKEFTRRLSASISDKKEFNQYFSLLTAPSALSFVAREEHELVQIGRLPKRRQISALEKHRRKYFWLQNSYVEEKELTVEFFARRLSVMKQQPRTTASPNGKKEKLIRQLRLDPASRRIIDWIDFATIWQDDRKIQVLQSITYLGRVLREVSHRLGFQGALIHYLTPQEMLRPARLADFAHLEPVLRRRCGDCYVLVTEHDQFMATGKVHDDLLRQVTKKHHLSDENEIHATTANGGTAIGRVVICKGLRSLENVKPGDIIIASMTRPEFAPALKKAAAIVTDEGGITCHAAIVARELNIPCVIGAKIATKILHNGMLVEVKANHGVVRILKK